MKRIIYTLSALLVLILNACEDFTEIEPKGKNLLTTVNQLDALLNYEYYYIGYQYDAEDQELLIGDMFPITENIPNLLSSKNNSLNKIYLTWDSQSDRLPYSIRDSRYNDFYKIIGSVANPVLMQIDNASGDSHKANQLKAEAYILRAYFHYLLVNHFAKAYNPSSASQDGGIPYVKEDDNIHENTEKLTVQEVYDNILADIQQGMELNSLPNRNTTLQRVSLPFAYAVKAKVLMSMQKYDEAMSAAEQSLAIKSDIDDYRVYLGNIFTRPELESSEELFFTSNSQIFAAFTPELNDMFEEGHILHENFESDMVMTGTSWGMSLYGIDTQVWFGINTVFNSLGLSTIDMYLVKAECLLRKGNITEAMEILDLIRENRIDPDYFQSLANSVSDKHEAIQWLKRLSRTENIFTLKNYINIKRWNVDMEWRETLKKSLQGKEYSLAPDSPLWIYPFPTGATSINPNLTQNY